MKKHINIPQAPGGNYREYSDRTTNGEKLTQQEENALIAKWRESQSKTSLDRVYLANAGLVYKLSDLYNSQSVSKEDLIQAGMEGLAEALKAFKIDSGVPFGTYAAQWVKQAMRKFLMTSDGPVRMATSESLRKLYFKLPKHLPVSRPMTQREVNVLAEKLEVSPKDIREMENRRRTSYMVVQHTDTPEGSEADVLEGIQLTDDRDGPEATALLKSQLSERRLRLEKCLDGLNDRQKIIIRRRYLVQDEDRVFTQKDLAAALGVSYQAIQQNEKKALKALAINVRKQGGKEVWLQ